jgi:hypothetical protein
MKFSRKNYPKVEPQRGFEPLTNGLQNRRSAGLSYWGLTILMGADFKNLSFWGKLSC